MSRNRRETSDWQRPPRKRAAVAFFVLALAHFAAPDSAKAAPAADRPFIAIENIELIDVVQGKVTGPRTVLLGGGRIAAIIEPGTAVGVPPDTITIDGHGKFLMPGLTDMHVHLFNNAANRPPNTWAFPFFVVNGVTGVREMNATPASFATLKEWRSARDRGELRAPRVVAAGLTISVDPGVDVRRQIRKARSLKADFIKVFSDIGAAKWREAIDEARLLDIPVCGHVPADVSALDAAKAGLRSNEHLTQIYEACASGESRYLATRRNLSGKEAARLQETQERQVLFDYNPQTCPRVIAAIAATNQVEVPTLVLADREARHPSDKFQDDPRWTLLRSDEQARWQKILGTEKEDPRVAKERWAVSREIVRTMRGAGIRVLAGTDTPMPLIYPGFSLHKELELLVECGLTTADALRSATIWPAEFLKQSETSGSIEVGKRADLVLLDDNPLNEIRNTQRIHAVVLDGWLLKRADLDALLSSAGAGTTTEAERE